MLRSLLVTLAIAGFAPFASLLPAQQLAEGYSQTTTALPTGANNVLTTATGTIYFDGFNLTHAVPGSAPQVLLSFGSYTFGSFSTNIGTTGVLFGESSSGGIWSVPLNGQPAQQIATVPFNYDAVMLDDDRALVSAKTGGFSATDNDVMFVDLITGQTQLLAQFPGASGPLAIDAAGDIYYATSPAAFPAPTGTVSVLHLARATIDTAILNQTVLGVGATQVVMAGLDAAGDLAFDDDGDLFFVDWMNNQIGEINDADSANASMAGTLIDYAGSGLNGSVLQFTRTMAGAQVFEPFQPIGGQLLVHETDYVNISQIRTVAAHRPELTASGPTPIPSGNFTVNTLHGPQNGIGLLAFHASQAGVPMAFQVSGFEQPLLLNSALTNNPVLVPLAFDASGSAVLGITNPGFSPAFDATMQTVVFSAVGAMGTSQAISLQVGQ